MVTEKEAADRARRERGVGMREWSHMRLIASVAQTAEMYRRAASHLASGQPEARRSLAPSDWPADRSCDIHAG
jgi:hypothetical protein